MFNASKTSILMKKIKYIYYDCWQTSDENVSNLPLMKNGPWFVIFLTILYVYLAINKGPKWMKHREPFNLKSTLIFYNFLMVILNTFIFYKALIYTKFGFYPWKCSSWGENANKVEIQDMLNVGWLYFFSKFLDQFDTMFFILRKKNKQLTKLHLIHHGSMPLLCWLGLKFIANMSSGLVPFLNSFVHIVMYLYYGLSAMKINVWWKKYLTQLQIGQLIVIITHSCYFSIFSSCDLYPRRFAYPIGFLTLSLLALFANFFYNCYISPKNQNQIHVVNEKANKVE